MNIKKILLFLAVAKMPLAINNKVGLRGDAVIDKNIDIKIGEGELFFSSKGQIKGIDLIFESSINSVVSKLSNDNIKQSFINVSFISKYNHKFCEIGITPYEDKNTYSKKYFKEYMYVMDIENNFSHINLSLYVKPKINFKINGNKFIFSTTLQLISNVSDYDFETINTSFIFEPSFGINSKSIDLFNTTFKYDILFTSGTKINSIFKDQYTKDYYVNIKSNQSLVLYKKDNDNFCNFILNQSAFIYVFNLAESNPKFLNTFSMSGGIKFSIETLSNLYLETKLLVAFDTPLRIMLDDMSGITFNIDPNDITPYFVLDFSLARLF